MSGVGAISIKGQMPLLTLLNMNLEEEDPNPVAGSTTTPRRVADTQGTLGSGSDDMRNIANKAGGFGAMTTGTR